MRFVLGVDGGSSKTHALLVDETGTAIRFGEAGCGNHQSQGLDAAVAEIKKSIRSATTGTRETLHPINTACFCLAGADLEEDFHLLQPAMEGLHIAQQVIIKNDTLAAMRSGLSSPWGVVVICGTGFNAASRSVDGRELVLPGLGGISGDWGGGGELSYEMIRLVMRAWDGRGEPTLLTVMVLNALGITSMDDLLRELYHDRIPHSKILDLVPLLFDAADAGDAVSRQLVIQMGSEVGVTANTLIRRSGLEELDVEIVLGGSVFRGKGPLLIDTIRQVVHATYPRAKIIRPRFEPVVGAALLGLEAAGVIVNGDIIRRLDESLPERLKITQPRQD